MAGRLVELGPARVAEIDTSGMFGEVAGLPRPAARRLRERPRAARRRVLRDLPGDPAGRAGRARRVRHGRLGHRRRPGPRVRCPAWPCRPPWCAATSCRRGWVRRRSSWSPATRARPKRRSRARSRRGRAAARRCASTSGGSLGRVRRARGPAAGHRPRRRPAAGGRRVALHGRCSRRSRRRGCATTTPPTSPGPRRSSRRTTTCSGPRCGDGQNPAKSLARAAREAAGRGVRRRAHGAGRPALEGPDQRERQGSGLLQRAAGARPQRAHGLDEPAAREPRHGRRVPATTSRPTSASRGAPSSRSREYEALGVASELVAARGDSRARAAVLAGAAGRLRVLLPRPAVRRRPHARWTPSRSSRPASPAPATDGAVTRQGRRARPDRRRTRRAGTPAAGCSPARHPSRSRERNCVRPRRSKGRSSTLLAAQPARRARRARRCRRRARARRRGLVTARRPRAAVARPRQPGAARPAHRPLAGRRAARLPQHDRHISTGARSSARGGSGILVRRRGGGRRRRPAAHAVRGAGGPARGAGPSSSDSLVPVAIVAAYYGLTLAACGVPQAPTDDRE